MDFCQVCLEGLGRKHVISCSVCSCSVHRLCNTGISQSEYQRMKRGEITIKFVCTACQDKTTSAYTDTTPAKHTYSSSSGSYGLRGTEKRRKPSRLVDTSPPTKSMKPRKKREPTRPKSQNQSKKKTHCNQAATPEKEERVSDWYFYSPSPMRRVHTEEKDGFTISYFDDPGLAPGMPFNPTTPQLKKTKRIWVKTNRSIFITTPESKADPVFKVPTQSVGKYPELKRKRKADDTEPTSTTKSGSSSAPLTKRQRTDCATTIGSISAVTNSSVRSGMSVTLNSLNRSSNGTTMKRKADEMDLTPEGASNDRRWTETHKVKKRCVDFSDMPEQSFVSNSSANHSWLDYSFQSVSDIFNLSSGNEMNATRDSFGIGDSFNNSYNGSFYDSFSHLAELI